MSFTTRTFYAATCDYPGCGRLEDGGDYTFWSEPEHAREGAIEGDWSEESTDSAKARGNEQRLFCDGHGEHIVWLSDEDPGPMTSGDEEDARVLTLPDGERVVLEA